MFQSELKSEQGLYPPPPFLTLLGLLMHIDIYGRSLNGVDMN